MFGRLTGAEYLTFVGRMYGLDRETTAKRTGELLEFMQLANEPRKLVTDYSHGMQKKLALAAAVIHGPRILFLDEPFEGVDAFAAGTLKAMLQRMIARGARSFLPRTCWRLWKGFAATWRSSIADIGGAGLDRRPARWSRGAGCKCECRVERTGAADTGRDFSVHRGRDSSC